MSNKPKDNNGLPDAVKLPNGEIVLVSDLSESQYKEFRQNQVDKTAKVLLSNKNKEMVV